MHYFRARHLASVLTVQCVEIKIRVDPLDGQAAS